MTADGISSFQPVRNRRTVSGLRRFSDGVVALALWLAFVLALFIWYGAWLLPEYAVSIRILASVLSDLVWIPLGIILWFGMVDWIAGALVPVRGSFRDWVRRIAVFILTTVAVGLAHDLAFRFLFVPMVFVAIRSLVGSRAARFRLSPFVPAIPLWLFAFLVIGYYGWQLVPMSSPSAADTANLSIMSYNIHKGGNAEQRERIIETIRREQPDIVSMVEVRTWSDGPLFRSRLGDIYPYMITNENVHYIRSSVMVLSKYPISFKPIDIQGLGLGHIDFTFMDVAVGDRTVNLVSFHLITVGHYFERMHHDEGDIRDRLAESAESEAAIDETRFVQVRTIGSVLETFEGPIILCGDLNDTSNSRVYRYFRKRYDDPFAMCGWGLGLTFGREWLLRKEGVGRLPLIGLWARDVLRIDHVFVGGGVTPVSMRVVRDADASDHRPVIATVRID